MTLREVVSRLDAIDDPDSTHVIYATKETGGWIVDAPAFVVEIAHDQDEDYREPPGPAGTTYMLAVFLAKEAIEVFGQWRGNPTVSPQDQVASVLFYIQHDAYLPVAEQSR